MLLLFLINGIKEFTHYSNFRTLSLRKNDAHIKSSIDKIHKMLDKQNKLQTLFLFNGNLLQIYTTYISYIFNET